MKNIFYYRDPRKGEYDDTDTVLSWSAKRYTHILQLRQQALDKARKMWVDYVLMIDADNIILHTNLLTTLIQRNKVIVGPMLETGVAFSNYWSGQVNLCLFEQILKINKERRNWVL